MKTKNMRKKALMSSLAMLLVAVVALSAATYAWFTNSKDASISTITVQTDAASGLQFSPSGAAGTWSPSLNCDDETPTKFVPVSAQSDNFVTGTAGAYAIGVQFYSGSVADNGEITVATTAPTGDYAGAGTTAENTSARNSRGADPDVQGDTGDAYLVKHFYAKIDAVPDDPGYVTLSLKNFAVTSSDDIVKATRIALVSHGSVDAAAITTSTTYATAFEADAWTYEPSASVHTAAARALGAPAAAPATTYAMIGAGTFALNNLFNQSVATKTSAVTGAYQDTIANFKAASDSQFHLSKGITWLTLYIWVEGQDVDCQNDISGGSLTVDATFTIA